MNTSPVRKSARSGNRDVTTPSDRKSKLSAKTKDKQEIHDPLIKLIKQAEKK